jgi:hypothetical protein
MQKECVLLTRLQLTLLSENLYFPYSVKPRFRLQENSYFLFVCNLARSLIGTVKLVYNVTTLATPKLWPLLTSGSCSEVESKNMVALGRWSLFGGGR